MPHPTSRDRAIAWLLRGLGMVDACAIVIAFLPGEAILQIHYILGLAPLPDAPLVSYLIRSTSVLYALHGGLMLGLATDVARYRPVIRLLGGLAMVHGVVIFGIDQSLGMPWWWNWMEGPTFALCGVAVLTLSGHPARSTDVDGAT